MWQAIYQEFRRWAKVSRRAVEAYKRTEITVETDQLIVIRRARSTRGWCADCGREVDLVGLKEAREILARAQPLASGQMTALPPLALPMLPGEVGGEGWHMCQAPDGSLAVCLESLLRP